jgi:hypothetical protein
MSHLLSPHSGGHLETAVGTQHLTGARDTSLTEVVHMSKASYIWALSSGDSCKVNVVRSFGTRFTSERPETCTAWSCE